jgi:hypothetical protein
MPFLPNAALGLHFCHSSVANSKSNLFNIAMVALLFSFSFFSVFHVTILMSGRVYLRNVAATSSFPRHAKSGSIKS